MSVLQAIDQFFQTRGFMPHGMCLMWRPSILWMMVAGNALTAFSYFMIPVALIYLILKRKDIGFKWIFILFGAFILFCGFTHVMGIVTLFWPAYGLEALVLAMTGIVSFITAVLLWPLLPTLFKLPSPWILEDMNKRLYLKNKELAHSEFTLSKFAAIVESTQEAIIGKTLNNIIESWNPGAEKLYGYRAEEVIGKSVSIIFPKNRITELAEIERELNLGKPVHYLETERLTKTGELIPVAVTVSPIKDKRGNLIGACSISHDIREWKQVQKMKDEFVSIVSHELRTPLTSVQGSLAILLAGTAGELPEKAIKLLQIGKQNTERLVRLINDILDIAKIEAGKIDFKIETIQIETIVKEAMTANEAFANKFEIKLALISHSDAIVNVDHDRLLQVITNLLSNAIKFSYPKETVTILIEEKEKKVKVTVTNKGAGIPEKFQANIFGKFSQANTHSTRTQTGTGLGLSISKEIIERLKGKIGFTSVENKETSFYFELPIAIKIPGAKRIYNKIPKILIYHADPESTTAIKELLENNGFEVIVSEVVQEAESFIRDRHVDGIILDLRLPDRDGITYLKKLRDRYTAAELPIIAISFNMDKEKEAIKGNAFSVLDWLEKPVNIERLYNDVKIIKKHINVTTPNILFVEDEVDLIEVIANLLQKDATVVGATTLREARLELEKNHYDLVILDLLLPDGSGVDLLPEISKKQIPVIVFSAYELPAKFTPYVVKTLMKSKTSPHDFLQTVQNAIYNKKLEIQE